MILEILKYPDPRLTVRCREVEDINEELRELAQNMLETMYEAEGVGLAAPQIGSPLRLVVMDPAQREGERQPRVFINPVLEPRGEVVVSPKEGCLSVPLNFRADVPRYESVHVSARDLEGNAIDEVLEGFPAIVLQHETDHLEGTLFIDRISHLRRNMYDNKVKKWQKSQA